MIVSGEGALLLGSTIHGTILYSVENTSPTFSVVASLLPYITGSSEKLTRENVVTPSFVSVVKNDIFFKLNLPFHPRTFILYVSNSFSIVARLVFSNSVLRKNQCIDLTRLLGTRFVRILSTPAVVCNVGCRLTTSVIIVYGRFFK